MHQRTLNKFFFVCFVMQRIKHPPQNLPLLISRGGLRYSIFEPLPLLFHYRETATRSSAFDTFYFF